MKKVRFQQKSQKKANQREFDKYSTKQKDAPHVSVLPCRRNDNNKVVDVLLG
jgi:hypothetical protein